MAPPNRDHEQRPNGRADSPILSLRQRLRSRWSKKRSTVPPTLEPTAVAGSSGRTKEEPVTGDSSSSGHNQAGESGSNNGASDSIRFLGDLQACMSPVASDEELHTAQSLWDRAYVNLGEKDEHLVKRYEELLLKETGSSMHRTITRHTSQALTMFSGLAQDGGAANKLNETSRQVTLDTVIRQGLGRMEEKTAKYTIAGHEFVLRDQVSDATKLVLWGKDLIGEAMKFSPEASIVWAGVCLILPLLTNPTTADEANRDGFAYVSTRMRYYTALGPLLEQLCQNPKVNGALRTEANGHIIDLYQHILEFQISSVLRFYYSSLRRYGSDVLQQKDWKHMRLDIEKLDATLHQNLTQISTLVGGQELEDLNKTSRQLNETTNKNLEVMQSLLCISEQQLEVTKDQRGIAQKQLNLQEDVASRVLSQERAQCLQLFHLTDSTKDITYKWYKGRIEGRVEGTCQWFLGHENFQMWLGQGSGPLLVSADPGCGKSVLSKYLIDNVLPAPAVTVCYFFFKDQDQNTVRQALCAVLHQLLSQTPELIDHAVDQWKKDGPGLVNSTNSLWSVFENAVQDSRAGSVIVVLDALDECGYAELENLAKRVERQFCGNQGGYQNLRYLLTSRPYDQIISSLQPLADAFPHVRIPGEGEHESDIISREVDLVVKHRVDGMDMPPQVKRRLEKRLLEVPHRTYLWVYLVFDHLKTNPFKKTGAGVESAIATLPKNVNAAYEQILNKSPEPHQAHKVLCMILAAERPLSISEMNHAVNTNDDTRWLDDLDLEEERDFQTSLRNWCGLFVAIHDRNIYFLHQTAREFLLSGSTSQLPRPASIPSGHHWQGSITGPAAQKVLAEACIRYLGFFGIGVKEYPGDSMSTATRQSANDGGGTRESAGDSVNTGESQHDSHHRRHTCAFLHYSALNWVVHFREAGFGMDTAITSLVLKICDPYLPSCSAWWDIFCEYSSFWDTNFRLGVPRKPGTSLIIAAILGFEDIAKFLLAGGADAEAVDRNERCGLTPLSWAAFRGHGAIVGALLAHGAHVNANKGVGRRTALSYAAERGHKDIVSLLLSHGAEANKKDGDGQTPLLWAAIEGHEAVVGLLVAHGADVEVSDEEYGQTPVSWAAEHGHGGVVRLLLAHGVEIEAKDKRFGRTALSFAIDQDRESVAKLLLAHGADVEAIDEDGRSLLSWAVITDYKGDMVKLLLSHDADVEAPDKDGRTPLSWAVAQGGGLLTKSNRAVVKLLLAHGVNVEAKDKNGRTPLSWAASRSNAAMVRLLLDHGVEVEALDEDGKSPLLWATREGENAAVVTLLDYGADLEVKDKDGQTPLLWAAKNGDEEVVKILLSRGADLDAKDKDGQTLLSWAINDRDEALVKLLLAYGADPTLSGADQEDFETESDVDPRPNEPSHIEGDSS